MAFYRTRENVYYMATKPGTEMSYQWIYMPCGSDKTRSPVKIFSEANADIFREKVKKATSHRGYNYMVIGAIGGREGDRDTCETAEVAEVSNVWLYSLMQGENSVSKSSIKKFGLQNKKNLHDTLVRLGFSQFSPRVYNYPFEMPKSYEYPVILKRITGTFGRGVYIVKSSSELENLVKEGDHAIKQGQRREHSNQVGVDFLVEQAVMNGTEYVMHYLRTSPDFPGMPWTRFFCGAYLKKSWKDKGLYVKGQGDLRPPMQEITCDERVVQVVHATLKAENVSGMGCINYKFAGGIPKIFDFNLRQCGSMRGPSPLMVTLLNSKPYT